MKKILLLLAVVAMLLPSCKKIEESIDALENRIDKLEQSIPTIDEQIESIQTSVEALEEVDESLDESIKALEANDEATAEEIAALKDADKAIEDKIEELKKYVDDVLKSTKDWVSATFATLEQLNALSGEVAALKSLVDANKAEAAANLANAISNLETSLKKWVGEQLSNYYTIADIDAKIAELQKAIADGDAALQQQLNELKSQLETTKQEVTEAYKKAIKEAIETNNGVINQKIASEIAAVNKRIDEEVAAINTKIAALQAQVDKNTEDIAKLLARIQSVSYVPQYSDGRALVTRIGAVSEVILDFKVSPKECVAELEKVWEKALSCEAVYTKSRTGKFIAMPITQFEADAESGVITVTASCENLSEEFFAGTQEASVALVISDGNNSVTSEYIPMVAKEAYSEDLETVIDLSINGTANCYIVSEKGHYSFDATIIGNGQNGIIADAGFHTSSASISPKSVSLLWDENSIVSDLHLNEGKVYFTASSNRGNALIAVKDSSDNIIWSWHIWATEKPKDYLSYDGYLTIDRNIGAISANHADVEATYGLYFQWGRKDPLRNPSIVVDTDDTTGNIIYTIEHPTQLVGGNFYNWQYSNKSEYLWGYEYNTKTIYDPCPVGYKVPFPVTSSAAYIYDSSRSGGRWDGELWYPFAGRLSYESGDPGENDERGIAGFYYVNTYSNFSKNDTYDQYFSASRVLIDNLQFKGFAESVRCIKE